MEFSASITRMRLRSSITTEEKQEQAEQAKKKLEEKSKINAQIDHKPVKYLGKIQYTTAFVDFAAICDALLDDLNKSTEIIPMGFDLEWPFSFQSGSGKTAVVQLSPHLNMSHVIHVSEMRSLPKAFSELLCHPNIRLTGVNIKNDVRKLARDFSGFDGDKIIENCIELSTLANTVLPITQRWSMAKLVGYLFQLKINKDKAVRMSQWHIIPLSSKQLEYAAIDSYMSLKLYLHLAEMVLKQNLTNGTEAQAAK